MIMDKVVVMKSNNGRYQYILIKDLFLLVRMHPLQAQQSYPL